MHACRPSTSPVMRSGADVREKLLSDRSYHIEFNSYLTNHVKHAIVGLHGLGAPAETLQRYTAVTPYGYHLEAAREETSPLTLPEYEQILGKIERFPDLLRFFDDQVEQHGIEAVLAEFMPRLVKGLAYMAYTFVDVHPERFSHRAHPDATPVDTLLRAAAAFHSGGRDAIIDIMHDPRFGDDAGTAFHPELYDAGFQWQLAKVLEQGHALFLEQPEWLDDLRLVDAVQGMYKALVLLYVAQAGAPGERGVGNFVALHAITALWGAEQVVSRLPEAQRRPALKCFWAAAVAVIASSGAGFPPREALLQAWRAYGSQCDVAEAAAGAGEAAEDAEGSAAVRPWPEITARACAEEEEHNIKLAYVCKQLWQRYGRWHAFRVAADTFTATPNIGPGKAAFKS